MRREVVVIEIAAEPLAITPGEWCPTCALSSAFKVDVAMTIGSSLRIATWHQCPGCHNLWRDQHD